MKTALAAILLLSSVPVNAGSITEAIGDVSNRQAYEDAPRYNFENLHATESHSHSEPPSTRRWWHSPNSRDGYAYENNCYRHEYRETFVPGTASSPGYVRKHSERIKIPCGYGDYPSYGPRKVYRNYTPSPDGNECGDGKLAGALVGGGAGAALSRGDGRWWAIPLGILVGSTVGCDMAGG